jgi:uncharacterized protein YutE (UPF0331/DUF86 family)
MARIEVIRRRLQRLDEYLEILQDLQRYSFEAFIEEPERYGSAERFLQLAIETLTDMGSHVIAKLGLGTVDSYRDIPQILAQQGYIDDALGEKWIRIIGFRNILVHEYLDLDREIVYGVLQEGLEDIAALRRSFAQFL